MFISSGTLDIFGPDFSSTFIVGIFRGGHLVLPINNQILIEVLRTVRDKTDSLSQVVIHRSL